MKKLLSLLLFSITAIILVACNEETDLSTDSTEKADVMNVYTTVYPLQYFTERIGAEYVNVKSIYPPGSNEHTFEPTQRAMIDLANSDLFFYIGLGLEGFVDKAKTTLKGENVKFIATADNVSEEDLHISTGHSHAAAPKEEGHDHEHDEDGHEEENHEDHQHADHDSHVWLSPVISQQLAAVIKDELIKAMPEQEQLFTQNYDTLVQELETLHSDFLAMAEKVSNKTFFVSHAAFGYIAGHYGFIQVPVAGLNSQSEPSQKELAAIVDLAKEENIKHIFFEQNVSSNLTKVIQKEIGAKASILHNLSVLTDKDIKNKEDYFSLMRANLDVLENALK